MTLGYSMEFCGTCGHETNHRIMERNGRPKKECVACNEQKTFWSHVASAKVILAGSRLSAATRNGN